MYEQVSHVFVGIHRYEQVSQVLGHCGTYTTTTSPKHPLEAPHQAGPTQGTPGHVPIHFLAPSQPNLCTRFLDFSVKNRCLDRSGPGHRNRLDPPDRPKHGLLALCRALYRTQLRTMKYDVYSWLEGASNMTPSNNFVLRSILPHT